MYKSSYAGFILTETLGRGGIFRRKLLGRASKVFDFQGYLQDKKQDKLDENISLKLN